MWQYLARRGHRDGDLRTYGLDKIELLYKYAVQEEAHERGLALDDTRVAVVSVVSDAGHKLYNAYRKALETEADGTPPPAQKAKALRKRVVANLVAMGAQVTDKRA